MQYHEHIAQSNARRERAEQLTMRYSQRPEPKRDSHLWASTTIQGPNRTEDNAVHVAFGLLFALLIAIASFALPWSELFR